MELTTELVAVDATPRNYGLDAEHRTTERWFIYRVYGDTEYSEPRLWWSGIITYSLGSALREAEHWRRFGTDYADYYLLVSTQHPQKAGAVNA